ncbi:MAG TPA: hypothetical protein VGQ62_01640, partial [Chloroflexota bacterium]|nr:hypothetical protein [Chloroflexota bacterium]
MSQSRNGRRADTKPRRLSVIADPLKREAVALAEKMRAWLKERNAYAEDPAQADVQVVIGGDGMVVRAARVLCDLPVL